jgi:hypothetical protein
VYNIIILRKGGGTMKKNDFIFAGILLLIGLVALLGFKLFESRQATGNVYAKIFYQDELILMIDLESNEYILYESSFKDQVYTDRSAEGIFYVPGAIMTEEVMADLWETDSFASTNSIIGIKLLVADGKIEVDYQVSPRDLCELQPPTGSSLQPIVCLPNQLVVSVVTNMQSDEFIPDAILE